MRRALADRALQRNGNYFEAKKCKGVDVVCTTRNVVVVVDFFCWGLLALFEQTKVIYVGNGDANKCIVALEIITLVVRAMQSFY